MFSFSFPDRYPVDYDPVLPDYVGKHYPAHRYSSQYSLKVIWHNLDDFIYVLLLCTTKHINNLISGSFSFKLLPKKLKQLKQSTLPHFESEYPRFPWRPYTRTILLTVKLAWELLDKAPCQRKICKFLAYTRTNKVKGNLLFYTGLYVIVKSFCFGCNSIFCFNFLQKGSVQKEMRTKVQ